MKMSNPLAQPPLTPLPPLLVHNQKGSQFSLPKRRGPLGVAVRKPKRRPSPRVGRPERLPKGRLGGKRRRRNW